MSLNNIFMEYHESVIWGKFLTLGESLFMSSSVLIWNMQRITALCLQGSCENYQRFCAYTALRMEPGAKVDGQCIWALAFFFLSLWNLDIIYLLSIRIDQKYTYFCPLSTSAPHFLLICMNYKVCILYNFVVRNNLLSSLFWCPPL
jgi:hypothetical protein